MSRKNKNSINNKKKNNLEGNMKSHPLCVSSNNKWNKVCCLSARNECKSNCVYNELLSYNDSIKNDTFTYFEIQPDTIFRNIDAYNKVKNNLYQYRSYYNLF